MKTTFLNIFAFFLSFFVATTAMALGADDATAIDAAMTQTETIVTAIVGGIIAIGVAMAGYTFVMKLLSR